MKIYKLYEFLNLEKHYPYELIREEDVEETETDTASFDSIYEFKSKDNKIYIVCIYYYGGDDKSISFDWAEKSDWDDLRIGKIHSFDNKRDGSFNINYMELILNTIFKILLDYLDHYNIGLIKVGSNVKYKYKAYKSIIKSMSDKFEIVKDQVIPKSTNPEWTWPENDFYSIEFKEKD